MTRSAAKNNFWSRRKAGVQKEAELEEVRVAEQVQQAEVSRLEAQSDDEILQELGLPDPESLTEGDDFSGFMAKAVPERLRRRALRQLWGSNPVLANVDGLVDYGEDFTDSAMVIEGMQSAYQVGKGMLKHVEEMARQAEEAEELEEAEEALPIVSTRPPEERAVTVEDEATADAYVFEDALEDEISEVAPRRRMQFAQVETEDKAASLAVTE